MDLEGRDFIPGYGFFRRTNRRRREAEELYDTRMNFRLREVESMEDFHRISNEVLTRIYMDRADPVVTAAFMLYQVAATDLTFKAIGYTFAVIAELMR
jgi:hypothetical protein